MGNAIYRYFDPMCILFHITSYVIEGVVKVLEKSLALKSHNLSVIPSSANWLCGFWELFLNNPVLAPLA